MNNNALSIANSILDLAFKDEKPVKPLALMKLVYIAYGNALGSMLRDVIDPRFDRVEAWKYGPVIPSVYHSFKHFQNKPVTEKAVVMIDSGAEPSYVAPEIVDGKLLAVIKSVWEKFKNYSDSKLVDICHKPGSPWSQVYVEGKNEEIPENITRRYYLYELGKISEDSDDAYKDYMLDSIIGSWSDLPSDFSEKIIAARHTDYSKKINTEING